MTPLPESAFPVQTSPLVVQCSLPINTCTQRSVYQTAALQTSPLVVQCSSAPPSSSALTSSPVAALTKGGPPRKMVPLPLRGWAAAKAWVQVVARPDKGLPPRQMMPLPPSCESNWRGGFSWGKGMGLGQVMWDQASATEWQVLVPHSWPCLHPDYLTRKRVRGKRRRLEPDNHALVRHGRHVGTAGGAGAQHNRNLGDAGRRHAGLRWEEHLNRMKQS